MFIYINYNDTKVVTALEIASLMLLFVSSIKNSYNDVALTIQPLVLYIASSLQCDVRSHTGYEDVAILKSLSVDQGKLIQCCFEKPAQKMFWIF